MASPDAETTGTVTGSLRIEALLSCLHRDPSTWVSLLRRMPHDDGFTPLPIRGGSSVRVAELQAANDWLPHLKEALTVDAVVSLNGFWRSGTHKSDDVRRLNACWVDCDPRIDLDREDAQAMLLRAAREGIVPWPTVTILANEGAWALWSLMGDPKSPNLPPEGRARNRALQSAVNRAIALRLQRWAPALRPDFQAVDPSRHVRIDGSIGADTRNEIVWSVHYVNGAVRMYRLEDLAETFGVQPPPPYLKRNGAAPRRTSGHVARFQSTLDEALLVAQERGFRKGCRNRAVNALGYLMSMAGQGGEKALRMAAEVAVRCCTPPLPLADAVGAARSGLRYAAKVRNRQAAPVRNVVLAEALGVTAEDAVRLGLTKVRPDYEKAPPKGAKARREARHEWLLLLAGEGPLPPFRKLLEGWLAASGERVSVGTLKNDLDALKLRTGSAEVAAARRRRSVQNFLFRESELTRLGAAGDAEVLLGEEGPPC